MTEPALTAHSQLCMACRTGDISKADAIISTGVDINESDEFQYTPLYLASLCGHEEVVRLLLDRGAVCDSDKYEGARCIYGALTDSIRNLLISRALSKAVDTTLPFASHIRSLLTDLFRDKDLITEDIIFRLGKHQMRLHRFMLTSRSPYFKKKFEGKWADKTIIELGEKENDAMIVILEYLYLTHDLNKLDRIEIRSLIELCTKVKLNDYAMSLEEYSEGAINAKKKAELLNELQKSVFTRAKSDLTLLVNRNIIGSKLTLNDPIMPEQIWELQYGSGAFPDMILKVFDDEDGTATYYPVHRAILIRAEYFLAMFTSQFSESHSNPVLGSLKITDIRDPVPVIPVSLGSATVAEIVIRFLYFDVADVPMEEAIDCLYAGELLLNDRFKTMVAVAITSCPVAFSNDELYSILRAGWVTRVTRLEHFVAKNIAQDLDSFLADPEFHKMVRESAERVENRHETDTIELVDDIRYWLQKKHGIDQEGLFEGEVNDYYEELPGWVPFNKDIQQISDLLEKLDLSA